jgi:hypothetical protein
MGAVLSVKELRMTSFLSAEKIPEVIRQIED